MRTIFDAYWHALPADARNAWVKRTIWTLAKTLEETYWSKSLLEGADDLVLQTLERVLLDPTGEYAPRDDVSPEHYFRRCLWIRIRAVVRMARAGKRRYLGANHLELDDLNADTPVAADTPETMLAKREATEEAQRAIARAIANSRLRGITRRYAENLVQFAAEGLGTAEIARRFATSEANVRSARRRLMMVLRREGVLSEDTVRFLRFDNGSSHHFEIAPSLTDATEPHH
jgi:DNA-directed RNA polymerase specialized sigma24 family protein